MEKTGMQLDQMTTPMQNMVLVANSKEKTPIVVEPVDFRRRRRFLVTVNKIVPRP